ncbi:hypothetical protein [Leptolyngbya sp. 7M]|uniref:hypothetical protein n=1 Tax=Leptolyngbya sp. 7M TaxID=2812896 RepID=UPI001B8DA64B|nr:hypothetical protein [Leptolyngbya sp. 7M]QYO65849.1 hypothetical protein JVX88_03370 [Leptolyngbya sp. 7M]
MSDELFGRALTRVKVWAGAIGANGDAKDMKAAAIVAQKRIDLALNSAAFLQSSNSNAYQKLVDASGYLNDVIEYLEKGEKIYKDLKAVNQIFQAIQVLKDDNIMINDPASAAAAFDSLFQGFGTLAKHFPPPFNSTVGELLFQCGDLKFFSNMNRVMTGQGSNLGRAMWLRDNIGRD